MKWITRERVKVDCVACLWLIKQFVDQDTGLLFVPIDQVMEVAEREGAIPYDVKDVELGHPQEIGRTTDPVLVLPGKIVNGADTDNTLWHQYEGAGFSSFPENCAELSTCSD